MIKPQQGFIFVMTLITIAVLSGLVLLSLQHILLYQKTINRKEIDHRNFFLVESLALQLARHGQAMPCLHSYGAQCTIKKGGETFAYRVEDLGDFPCLVVKTPAGKFSTHHQRISVKLLSTNPPQATLQIRVLTATALKTCTDEEREVHLGVVSWRYVRGEWDFVPLYF